MAEKEESIFDFLYRVKEVEIEINEHLHEMDKPDPDVEKLKEYNSLVALKKKLDKSLKTRTDIANKIEQEFNKKKGKLGESERLLALDYLMKDYRRAEEAVYKHFSIARDLNAETNMHVRYMGDAWLALKRARRDVNLVMKLNPDSTEAYLSLDSLNELTEQVYFVTEFPDSYKELYPLHIRLRSAFEREYYEDIADLRTSIKLVLAAREEVIGILEEKKEEN